MRIAPAVALIAPLLALHIAFAQETQVEGPQTTLAVQTWGPEEQAAYEMGLLNPRLWEDELLSQGIDPQGAPNGPPMAPETLSPMSTVEIIETLARQYGVDPLRALRIARCESGLNPYAVGDHGLAVGIWQFHPGTFNTSVRAAGFPSLANAPNRRITVAESYSDPRSDVIVSTHAAMWLMSQPRGLMHWVCR